MTRSDCCRPRGGCGLHQEERQEAERDQCVAVPARGKRRSAAGGGRSEPLSRKHPDWQTQSGWESAGAMVSADCITTSRAFVTAATGCRPREGCGLHPRLCAQSIKTRELPSPRGERGEAPPVAEEASRFRGSTPIGRRKAAGNRQVRWCLRIASSSN